jgi:hypothetical protein
MSQQAPLVTCVDGRYEPHHPTTYVCQEAVALLIFPSSRMELFSHNSKCSQALGRLPNSHITGHTLSLLDSQLLLIGDESVGAKWKHISIESPRNGLLAVKYSRKSCPVKGSPFGHTAQTDGNKMTVIGGDQRSKARLDTDIWTPINLRWKNQSSFTEFSSGACTVKLGKESHLLIGGLKLGKKPRKAVSTVVRMNATDGTMEELAPMEKPRAYHSCEMFTHDLVIISGGTEGELQTNETSSTLPDELYSLSSNESHSLGAADSIMRQNHKLIRLGEAVYGIGGTTIKGENPSIVKIFNSEKKSWENHSSNLMSSATGEVAVTPFPLSAVDCVGSHHSCQCGVTPGTARASRVVNGEETEVRFVVPQCPNSHIAVPSQSPFKTHTVTMQCPHSHHPVHPQSSCSAFTVVLQNFHHENFFLFFKLFASYMFLLIPLATILK